MTIIAIDGPAGSGKSTVARAVARRVGLGYLDTGAMYRAVAHAALQKGVDAGDADEVARLAATTDISLDERGVFVDGADATAAIRSPEVDRTVSAVAANPAVRREMVERQRQWVHERGGGVVEGRDIGTVVFPDADVKVFLTARLEVRAARRHREAAEMAGRRYEEVEADMERRDSYDSSREHSPLQPAADALVIDTSDRDVDDIVSDVVGRLS